MTTPPSKLPQISVAVSPEEYERIQQFAYRVRSSVAGVTKLAVLHLIADAMEHKISLLPEEDDGHRAGHA